MANRSYLYTANHFPESPEWENKRDLHSISEWSYDIPLVFKLLLSGNPVAVKSSIWETPEKIALAGDFKAGFHALEMYLSRLPHEAEPLVNEATAFLSKTSNQRRYFILECGEIFDMEAGSLEARNLALLDEIQLLRNEISTIDVPKAPSPKTSIRGIIDKLLSRKQEVSQIDPLKPFYGIGLGNWSNILYFQFSEE